MTTALTRSARQARIAELIAARAVTSQTQLAALLAESGFEVTQATLSRDLEELGAVKMRGSDGAPASYVLPPENAPLRPAQSAPAGKRHHPVAVVRRRQGGAFGRYEVQDRVRPPDRVVEVRAAADRLEQLGLEGERAEALAPGPIERFPAPVDFRP